MIETLFLLGLAFFTTAWAAFWIGCWTGERRARPRSRWPDIIVFPTNGRRRR